MRREGETGHAPELVEINGYDPRGCAPGHLRWQVNGEHDLFGDGAVVAIPPHGHTPVTSP